MAVDAVQELLDLVKNNWDKTNTDTKTPRFEKIWGGPKTISLVLATPDQDLVTFYETTAPHEHSGIGSNLLRHTSNLRIDVRSVNQESHALKVKEEVLRILSASMATPGGSFDKLKGPFEVQNLSDKGKLLFRYVISCQLLTHRRTYA